jgi:hypothetical protein
MDEKLIKPNLMDEKLIKPKLKDKKFIFTIITNLKKNDINKITIFHKLHSKIEY